jgi:hypothetical protein
MGAALAAVAVGFAVLAHFGHGVRGVTIATQSVARLAFAFFWLAYVGGGLAALFGPAFESLARHRRELGLAFAAALAVHLTLVAWLFHISYYPPVPNDVILWFGIGALWVYALALGSVERVRQLFDAGRWRVFTALGMEYVAYLFFRDFVLLPLQYGARHPLFYAPFSILIILGPVLRWGPTVWRLGSFVRSSER